MIKMARREQTIGGISPVIDERAMVLDNGWQIAWEFVSNRRRLGVISVTLAAAAAADAEELTVDPLNDALPQGAVLVFPGGKVVTTTARAEKDAVAVPVTPVPAGGIADNAEAIYGGGAKHIPAFTDMAKMADDRIVPYDDRPGAETDLGFLATSVTEGEKGYSLSGTGLYRGGGLYENLLPVVLNATRKTQLNSAGGGFWFDTYGDSRAAE